jgi:hypothetical protein
MKLKYVIIIGIAFLQSCVAEKPIKITPFSTYANPNDTTESLGELMVCYNNFFLVSNYRDTKKVDMQIDSFVTAFIAKNEYSPKTDRIDFFFYKETSQTNMATIQRNPKEVDPYSNEYDWVYYYSVKLDSSRLREKIKNGHVIERMETTPFKSGFKIKLVKIDTSG